MISLREDLAQEKVLRRALFNIGRTQTSPQLGSWAAVLVACKLIHCCPIAQGMDPFDAIGHGLSLMPQMAGLPPEDGWCEAVWKAKSGLLGIELTPEVRAEISRVGLAFVREIVRANVTAAAALTSLLSLACMTTFPPYVHVAVAWCKAHRTQLDELPPTARDFVSVLEGSS